jgi:PD-(D/E)XK endonuclease
VLFNACSRYGHHANPRSVRRSYEGEIDLFAVHCLETERVYLVPIAHAPPRVLVTLSVDPPLNARKRKIRFGADYEIAAVATRPTTEPAASAGAG